MKLIFVYNANSGFVNSLLDTGHKVISPSTYSCNLCKITYGLIGEKAEWKKFRKSTAHELDFLHKDEFEKKYKDEREYPLVLTINDAGQLVELISRDELNKMKDLNELIQRVK